MMEALSNIQTKPKTLFDKIFEKSNLTSASELYDILEENAYDAILYGVPFRLIDEYAYASKKYTYNDPRRLLGALCAVQFLRITQGHTFFKDLTNRKREENGKVILLSKGSLHAEFTKLLMRSEDLFPKQRILYQWFEHQDGSKIPLLNNDLFFTAVQEAQEIKIGRRKIFALYKPEDGGSEKLLHLPTYWSEYQIAQRVASILMAEKTLHTPRNIIELKARYWDADSDQVEAIINAFESKFSIITGGPGTGKSKTIEILTTLLLDEDESMTIKICAPTGIAAQNLQERLMQSESEKVKKYFKKEENSCRTIHSLLELLPSKSLGVLRSRYSHTREYLNVDVLIVDETSMTDVYIMRSLLWAVSNKTQVIIVGDTNQLNSIGPGKVLFDLTEGLKRLNSYKNFPVLPMWKNLEIIHRTASDSLLPILANTLLIKNAALRWTKFKEELENCIQNGDIEYIREVDESNILKQTVEKYLTFNNDISLITTRHEGAAGRIPLNEEIQWRLLNKIGFVKGTVIVQNKNNYTHGVMNGEKGVITKVTKKGEITARFSNGRIFSLDETDAEEEWLIGYAVTVHKSQGSESDAVLLPIWSDGNAKIWNRSLLYTAMTRSKEKLVLIGNDIALEKAVKNVAGLRQTRLAMCYRNLFFKKKD